MSGLRHLSLGAGICAGNDGLSERTKSCCVPARLHRMSKPGKRGRAVT